MAPKEMDVAYHSVGPDILTGGDPTIKQPADFDDCDRLTENRGWAATVFIQLFAILWLVPIVALLYLNWTGYIIGASAWCPDGNCYLDSYNPVGAIVEANLRRFSHQDHNLLGALQFVAKALEIWFCIIASAFVYLITMRIANRGEGLPIGYLTRHIEFTDAVSLADPLIWTTGPFPFGKNKSDREKKLGRRVFALVTLTVCLCVVCNLMGPATAVLVIPSLGWVPTENIGNRSFTQLNAGQPPSYQNDNFIWWSSYNCDKFSYFDNEQYSCLQTPYGDSLDAWAQSYVASGVDLTGITQQSGLSMQYNYSYTATTDYQANLSVSDFTFWAPSRQIISNMSIDSDMIFWISQGYNESSIAGFVEQNVYFPDPYDTYVEYNRSLDLVLQRNGPIAGGLANMWLWLNGTAKVINVDENRQIRCYDNYDLFWSPIATGSASGIYNKCVRTGLGWSDLNKNANFTIEGAWNRTVNKLNPNVDVQIYTSDKAVFFPNGVVPSWLPKACLTDEPALNKTFCDWDRLFTIDPSSPVANRSENVNTMEMTMSLDNYFITFAIDFTALFNFTTYSFDPSPLNNPTLLVQTLGLPTAGESFHVDPAWILAAWAVDAGGSLLPNRPITNNLLEVMATMFYSNVNDPTGGLYMNGLLTQRYKLGTTMLLPIVQTLSLIDHSTVITSDTNSKTLGPGHPILHRNAQMYVWSYGMGSRTAWLGAIVAIVGAAVVIFQVVLGFSDRRRYRSPTQLLVAALEHAPRGEFNERREEKVMARTRFHIRDNVMLAGKFSFYEPEDKGQYTLDRPA